MGIRDSGTPQSFTRVLLQVRPELRKEPIAVRQAFARLLYVRAHKNRRHKGVDDGMSISYQELAQRFGKGQFTALNKRLQILDVSPNWWKERGWTKAYTAEPDIEQALSEYELNWRGKARKDGQVMVGLDGKRIIAVQDAVASKDTHGVTARAWNRPAVTNEVPVDRVRLQAYAKSLEVNIEGPIRDLFAEEIPWLKYRLKKANRIMDVSRLKDGAWVAKQHYVESQSGRLYGQGDNLATVPTEVKQVALHGLYEYDIENCHFAILHQLAARHGLKCDAITHYLDNKAEVRRQIAAAIGVDVDKAKPCLIMLIYGAKESHRNPEKYKDAIPKEVGLEAALKLYQHPLFKALKVDVAGATKQIAREWPLRRKSFVNDYGKGLQKDGRKATAHRAALPKPSPAQILAHLLQGIEAKMLEAVRQIYPKEILLLQHDGFASSVKLDTGKMKQAILTATGYKMAIEEKRIALDAGLGY